MIRKRVHQQYTHLRSRQDPPRHECSREVWTAETPGHPKTGQRSSERGQTRSRVSWPLEGVRFEECPSSTLPPEREPQLPTAQKPSASNSHKNHERNRLHSA